jgi:hypothetical protein
VRFHPDFVWVGERANVMDRMATNRLITIAIITVLVLLIIGVIWSKFR